MEGNIHNEEMMGIIPRIVNDIFDHVSVTEDDKNTFVIKVSYFELYLETITDLLSSKLSPSKLSSPSPSPQSPVPTGPKS